MNGSNDLQKLQKQLVWAVRKVLWEGDTWGEDWIGLKNSAMWFTKDGRTFWFSESESLVYQKAIKVIIEYEPLGCSYSAKTLIKRWQGLLVKLVEEYEEQPSIDTLGEKITSWLEDALSAQEESYTYYAVIDNLKLNEERQIGRVMFGQITEEIEGLIREKIWALLDSNTYYKDKPDLISKIKDDMSESLNDFSVSTRKALAWTKIRTRDVDRGQELAFEAIEESLNLLRFLGAQASGELRRPLGMHGTVGEGMWTMPVISAKSWKLYSKRVLFIFDLSSIRTKDTGFVELEKILRIPPETRDELENKMTGVLVWLGQSAEEISETAQFIKVWIAMEMLLTGEKERATGGIVGERMAFLLESSMERRLQLVDFMKKVYSIRNEIVHKGRANNEEDVIQIIPYARAVAVNALNRVLNLKEENGWTSFLEMKEYLEELKYS